MTHDELRTRLAKLSPERLAQFLAGLARDTPDLHERVEALALSGDPKSLGRLLRTRLMAVKRGRRFIDYRQSRELAAELSGWLADVGDGLVETDPEAALGLLEEFIGSDGRIPGRVDDSKGLIGDAFRLACGMWHRAASKLSAILCYRALCEQILEEARSKAHGHASRYVAKLDALNLSIDGYGDFPDHVAYMAGLRERHGRKHAFWRRVKGE
jgi:hypothetical protein